MNRRGFLTIAGGAAFFPYMSFAATDIDVVLKTVANADFIAIGEQHDNPRHHHLQAELVVALSPAGLAFEMIPQAREEAVNRLRADGISRTALGEALEWADSGWPDWDLYAPILEAAPEAYIAGGGLRRSDLGAVYQKGAAGLGDALTERYALSDPLPDRLHSAMLDEQYDAHCGLVDREKLGAMVEVQRAWDASYADAWRRAGVRGGGQSVLICGNAHARLERGAPAYLLQAVPDAKIAAIGLLEEGSDPADKPYTVTLSAKAPERDDPCDEMRRALKKKS